MAEIYFNINWFDSYGQEVLHILNSVFKECFEEIGRNVQPIHRIIWKSELTSLITTL